MKQEEEEFLYQIFISETGKMNLEIENCIKSYFEKINKITKETGILLEGKHINYPLDIFIATAHGYLFEKLYKGDKEIGNQILDNYVKMVNDK
jgi:hypothetical protein